MDRDLKNRFHFLFNIMKNLSSHHHHHHYQWLKGITHLVNMLTHTQTLTTSHRKQNKKKLWLYLEEYEKSNISYIDNDEDNDFRLL